MRFWKVALGSYKFGGKFGMLLLGYCECSVSCHLGV
jgi:uncharacterized membrane protein YedE/YeeE